MQVPSLVWKGQSKIQWLHVNFQKYIFTNLQVLSCEFHQLTAIQSKTLENQQSSSPTYGLITPGDNHQELAHLRWRDLKTLPWALETKSSAYHFPSVCLSVSDWQISHSINIAFFIGSSSGLRSVSMVILSKRSWHAKFNAKYKKRNWIHLGLW